MYESCFHVQFDSYSTTDLYCGHRQRGGQHHAYEPGSNPSSPFTNNVTLSK